MRIKWFSLIRVTGLLLVLLYHFFKTIFTGGFIGVDLFFTFSGFLITGLILDEFAKKETFQLGKFYRRRFYRIVPPLVFLVLVTLPFTLLVSRDFIANIGKQIAAVIGFVTNYFEILTGGTYENKFIPHLFLHTWSLALEAHFYLIWGLLMFLVVRSIRKTSFTPAKKLILLRQRIFFISLGFFLTSFLILVIRLLQKTDTSSLYFSDMTHSFPFFIGSAFACLSGVQTSPASFKRKFTSWSPQKTLAYFFGSFVLLLVLSLTLKFEHWTTYLLGFLAASLLTGIMIYSARILHEKTPNAKEPVLLVFIADISYGIYLFHWPFLIIFDKLMNHAAAILITCVLSVFFSAVSYYFLEPLLSGKTVTLPKVGPKTLAQVKKPFLLAVVPLTLFAIFLSLKAPKTTSLEDGLWISSLQQDADNLKLTHDLVADAKTNEYNVLEGVSIIGDSVTLGARSYVSEHVENSSVDAEGNRTMDLAETVMKNQIKQKMLREYVVICIGTNSLDNYEEQTLSLLKAVPEGHHVILMTPFDGNADATWNSSKLAVFERSLPEKYDFVTIADWNKVAQEHPEAFVGSDGTHFAGIQAGNELYTQCINQALAEAKEKPKKSI